MLLQADRSHDYKIIPSPSRANIKWLNVVMDLNIKLCVYQEKKLMPKGQAYVDNSRFYFGIVYYLLGPMVVFVCPYCQRFLREFGKWQISLSRAP
jgi:hypothetical protein